MLVSFGNASGPPEPVDLLELSRHGSLFCTRPTLQDYTRTAAELGRSAQALFTVVQQGAVRPVVAATLGLSDAAEAHRRLEARQTQGAIVLLP
jgi:NADPH2:quinone reductase